MSEFSTGFVFDLQRFATKTFNGGAVGDETGVTLSDLFNNAGRAWLLNNAEKGVAEGQTFFWEKSALVELTPAIDNADETVAGALELVSGRYDDPTVADQDVTVIKRVDAIDAENLTGAANFKTIGSTTIVNPGAGATIAIGNNTLTFGGGGNDNKEDDSSLGVEVGTKINVTNGAIKNVEAAATEEITTADGTTADFVNGGVATFNGKAFNTIESFADGGSAELHVDGDDAIVLEVEENSTSVADGKTAITTTFDGQTIKSVAFAGNANSVSADIAFGGTANVGKDIAIGSGTVNVANIEGSAEDLVVYRLGAEGGDILDLTNADEASANKNISVSKTGKAKFVIARDNNEDTEDGLQTETITIGGTDYKFNDAQANGGVFVVNNNAVTGFVFRDVDDAIVIPAGASLTLYNGIPSADALSVGDNSDNMSFADIDSLPVSFNVVSDSEYMVRKTEDGYEVEVFDGTTVTVGDATIDFTLATARGNSKSPASAVITFGNDGLLQSISNGTTTGATGTNTGLNISGTAVKVSGLTEDNVAEGFTINNVAVNLESGEYTYEVEGEKNQAGVAQIQLESADETITDQIVNEEGAVVKVLPYEGGTGKVTYLGNEYSFVNASGKAYLYADADSLQFVFAEAGDAITIPVDAAATTELLYVDNNNDGTETAIATAPTVDNDYTVTMTKATTRRSGDAEFTISGIEADGTVRFNDGDEDDTNDVTFAFSAEGGTLTFDQTGAAIGFTAASGLVTMNEAAAGLLAADEDGNTFKIDGTGVNITATVDEDNESQLVYNKAENSLFGLADGSAVVDAGSITRIYAPTNAGTFTFGDTDAENAQAYTSESQGDAEDNERAFFTVAGDTATGFTFADVNDFITSENFSGLTLTDLPTGNTFDAPVVTEGEGDDTAPAAATLLKTMFDYDGNGTEDDCYSIYQSDLEGKTITFDDGTAATFNNAEDETEVFFGTDGKLLSIINLSSADDEVAIQNATGAVKIDDSTVEIVGGAFVYRMVEDDMPAIVDVTAGTTIKQAAGVEVIDTTTDDTANGTYTFGDKPYTVAGNEDGVRFLIDGEINVSGISNINGTESVTGAFGSGKLGATGFSINGESVIVTTDDVNNQYTVTESTFAGLKDGDEVVSAGAFTEFATAEDGLFTILGESMAVAGDSAVTFTVDGEKLTAVTELSGSVFGSFSSITVNGQTIGITETVSERLGGDGKMEVFGNETEDDVVKIGALSGIVEIVEAGGVSELVSDGTIMIRYGESNRIHAMGDNSVTFALAGNDVADIKDFADGVSATVEGTLDGLTINDKLIDVDGDGNNKIVYKADGAGNDSLVGIDGDATINAVGNASAVKTSGDGTYNFFDGKYNFTVEGEGTAGNRSEDSLTNALWYELNEAGGSVITGISELDGTISGSLNDIAINNGSAIQVVGESGANTELTYSVSGVLSGIKDGDTISGAASATTVNAAEQGIFTFANGTFQIEGDADGVDFLVEKGTANVTAVNGLAQAATLRGALDQLLSINGVSFAVTGIDGNSFIRYNVVRKGVSVWRLKVISRTTRVQSRLLPMWVRRIRRAIKLKRSATFLSSATMLRAKPRRLHLTIWHGS